MMTVERLFASILGSAFSIRSVELWDGEVPEALIQKVQEEAKSSKPPKDLSPATTRRRTKTETRDHTNGESSSKHVEGTNGNGSSSRHKTLSEGTHNVPKTVEDGTQTEEPYLASKDAVADESKPTKPTEEISSPGPSSRRQRQKRSESMASDVSMSGAVRDEQEPSTSNGKRPSRTGDSVVSEGTHKMNTTASETLQRQDSGFEAAAPPVQAPDTSPDNEAGAETPRRGLQAPPIRPAEASRNMNLRGGVSPEESSSQNFQSDSNEDPDRTPTRNPPQDRRHSYQNVFGKAFGRSSKQAPARDANHGIPPTSLDGRRPLFSRRRSSAIDPKPGSSRAGSSSNAPNGSNERTSSLTKDSNFGIPPGGLGDRRPLSFIRRLSAQPPAAESERPDSNHDTTADGPSTSRRPGSIVERPLSFIHRSKGKAPEEPQKFSKNNNFGIPPTGL